MSTRTAVFGGDGDGPEGERELDEHLPVGRLTDPAWSASNAVAWADPPEVTPAAGLGIFREPGGVQLVGCTIEGCTDPTKRIQLGVDWQREVNATPALRIPTVGCGNPWHYVVGEPPYGLLRGLSDPEPKLQAVIETWARSAGADPSEAYRHAWMPSVELEASESTFVSPVTLELQMPTGESVELVIDWPVGQALPVPGDALEIQDLGVASVSARRWSVQAGAGPEDHGELTGARISAVLIAGSLGSVR